MIDRGIPRRTALAVLASPALLALGRPAMAAGPNAWPDRPIKLIVAFAPGGFTDIAARLLAAGLSQRLGQTVLVDNRAGAAGFIGTQVAAQAPADGYTLLLGTISTHAINFGLYKKLPYDPVKDFVPVSGVARGPLVMVVHPSLGVRNVDELVARAKAQPGKMSYASSGAGSSAHLATELFLKMAGIDVLNVTYRGGAPAVQALLAGEVQMAFVDAVTALPLIAAKEVVAIGVSSLQRNPLTPDVPTIAEQGLPGFECSSQFALLAPAGTPEPIVRKLHAALVASMKDETVLSRLRQASNFPTVGTPEEFGPYLAAESGKWGEVIRSRGITAD